MKARDIFKFQDPKAEWEISYQSYVLGLSIITRFKVNVICYDKIKLHSFKNPIVKVNKIKLIALQQIFDNLMQLFIVIRFFYVDNRIF